MKRLLTLLFVFAVILIGVGFYRGWFTLSRPEVDKGSNKVELNLTVDQEKMKEDVNSVKDKAHELTDGAKDVAEGTKDGAEGTKESTKDGAKESTKEGEIGN